MSGSTNRVWIALFIVLVFICGLSVGVAVTAWRGFGPAFGGFRGPLPSGGPGGPIVVDTIRRARAMTTERILSRLETDPDFSNEQRIRLEAIFEEREAKFREFNREMRKRFEVEQVSLHEEISAVLTPAQMEIFEESRRLGRRWRRPIPPGGRERR